MPAGCDPKTDRDHRSRLQLQIRVIRSLPAVALAKEGYPWLITQKRSAGRSYPPGAVFSLRFELFPVLLRGEPELDTAVFENDHERVGVTRVQIATVHVKLPVESLHFGSALFAEKTGDRIVRGAFQFLLRNFLLQRILERLL